jgi:hypothetical protein
MVSPSSLTDDELLRKVFMDKPNCTQMEIELSVRLAYYLRRLEEHDIPVQEYIDTKRTMLWPEPPKEK